MITKKEYSKACYYTFNGDLDFRPQGEPVEKEKGYFAEWYIRNMPICRAYWKYIDGVKKYTITYLYKPLDNNGNAMEGWHCTWNKDNNAPVMEYCYPNIKQETTTAVFKEIHI